MKIPDAKDVGLLAKGGGYYDKKEEAYDPAAYDVTAAASYEDDRRLAGMSGSCPPEDVVTCDNGFATSVGGNATVGNPTCQEACAAGGGECCVGDGTYNGDSINSCTGFNGKVCKSGDIPSCSDNRTSGGFFDFLGRACYNANITEVVNGCNGKRACDSAGLNGDLGRVVNGCYGGDSSCFGAARDGGNIGYINHGCRGVKACQFAAYGGSIDGISYACNNIKACAYLASDLYFGINGYDFASVNSTVVSCCNEVSECTGSVVDASGLPGQCPTPSPITASPSSPPSVNPSQQPTKVPTVSCDLFPVHVLLRSLAFCTNTAFLLSIST